MLLLYTYRQCDVKNVPDIYVKRYFVRDLLPVHTDTHRHTHNRPITLPELQSGW